VVAALAKLKKAVAASLDEGDDVDECITSSLEGLAQGPAAQVPTSGQIFLLNGFDTHGDHDSSVMPAQSFGGGALGGGRGPMDMVGASTRAEG
jgi:hypothetical protein